MWNRLFMEPPIVEPPTELPPGAKHPASGDPKKLKRMKKKLDELNGKIRHSKKKNNGLIHKKFVKKGDRKPKDRL